MAVIENGELTHVAGTFLIQADGAFLNGAGLGEGEDRNVTIPKTFRDGRNQVPYVSAQAWKRWLRTTAVQEAGWPASEPQAIGWNPKGNVNKIASQLNPVEYPEDDIFGYMRAQEGQGRRRPAEEDDEEEQVEGGRTRSVMRASPFAASLLVSLRSAGWRGEDEGFVHLTKYDPRALAEAEVERFLESVSEGKKDKKRDPWKRLEEFEERWAGQVKSAADVPDLEKLRELLIAKAKEKGKEVKLIENATSPLPYTTRFYNTHLHAIFCLNYSRLGLFWNVGDRIELEEAKVKRFLQEGNIRDVTNDAPYSSLTQNGTLGRVYQLVDTNKVRRERASALFRALSVLRGGAKQAQFGMDIAPKVLVLAGLRGGNPIFNHLFEDNSDGPALKIDTFKEVIKDYADRIATPVLLGVRNGYLKNEADVRALAGWYDVARVPDTSLTSLEGPRREKFGQGQSVDVRVMTPVEAARLIGGFLP